MNPRDLNRFQAKAQLEMFYRLSVEEAIEKLSFLLEANHDAVRADAVQSPAERESMLPAARGYEKW
jgi:hypothetical protein